MNSPHVAEDPITTAEVAVELVLAVVARRYGRFAANSVRKAFVDETRLLISQELARRSQLPTSSKEH